MGAEAKRYLQEHSIPQLFEGLMTGLIYNKPDDPIHFLEGALVRIRKNPDLVLRWDSFIDGDNGPGASGAVNHVQRSGAPAVAAGGDNNRANKSTNRASSPKTKKKAESKRSPSPKPSPKAKAATSKQGSRLNTSTLKPSGSTSRKPSLKPERRASLMPITERKNSLRPESQYSQTDDDDLSEDSELFAISKAYAHYLPSESDEDAKPTKDFAV